MNIRNATLAILLTSTLFIAGTFTEANAKKPADNSLLQLALNANASGPFAGEFDTLIAAVLAADPAVAAVLANKGQHTVFAPNDTAFSNLGLDPVSVAGLDQDTLTFILLYHVVRGRLDAQEVIASEKLNTLVRGKNGFIMQDGGMLTDNTGAMSTIIVTDIPASNGIIHVIDSVLMPE